MNIDVSYEVSSQALMTVWDDYEGVLSLCLLIEDYGYSEPEAWLIAEQIQVNVFNELVLTQSSYEDAFTPIENVALGTKELFGATPESLELDENDGDYIAVRCDLVHLEKLLAKFPKQAA